MVFCKENNTDGRPKQLQRLQIVANRAILESFRSPQFDWGLELEKKINRKLLVHVLLLLFDINWIFH